MQNSIHKSEVRGTARAPSSKSYTIRALMCAALAGGTSEIQQPLSSDDTDAAQGVLRKIGVRISPDGDCWQVKGGRFRAPQEDLFCGNSAATLRFMSAIGALVPGQIRLTAGPSLAKRPVKILVEALRKWEVDISCLGDFPPVIVKGGHIGGGLTELPGDISSQYVSALLLAAPLADRPAGIRLTTPLDSRPYVLMTLECLNHFGIQIKYSDDLTEYQSFPQPYYPAVYRVEGDWSSASYLLSLGAVAGEVQVDNLNTVSLQGDRRIIDLLREMGASVAVYPDAVIVKRGCLKAIKADLNDCIDLLPTMAALAALAEGTSEFSGIQRARLKESNRILAVMKGLERAGIQAAEEADKLTVTGGKPRRAVIDSCDDHRIAMAFSLLGAASGIIIEGAECVAKTYPEYWKVLQNLGVKTDER
ncbi:MAG: 3-phosphoshikimate 1-carboxyvinyltransferase [Dehalococcoidales bacterium]|nr:3-phosphoshikimate 1-carboxyvinyltransferase [Dehalococcoidales bacterium]